MTIAVDPARRDRSRDALRGLEGLREVRPDEEGLTLFVDDGSTFVASVIRALDAAAVPVGSIAVAQPAWTRSSYARPVRGSKGRGQRRGGGGMTAQAVRVDAAVAWNPLRQSLRAGWVLGVRELRTSIRTPAYLVPNLVMPIFFFFVFVGTLEEFAGSFGVENWEAFQLPVAITFAVQGGSVGLNMVADIESGYLDKLLATPASRLSILFGAMTADFMRVMAQATFVVLVAAAAGVDFATGAPGALVLMVLSGLYGLGFSGIGFAVALKTATRSRRRACGSSSCR